MAWARAAAGARTLAWRSHQAEWTPYELGQRWWPAGDRPPLTLRFWPAGAPAPSCPSATTTSTPSATSRATTPASSASASDAPSCSATTTSPNSSMSRSLASMSTGTFATVTPPMVSPSSASTRSLPASPEVTRWQEWLPPMVQAIIAKQRYLSEGELIDIAGDKCADSINSYEHVSLLQAAVGMVVNGMIDQGIVHVCGEDAEYGRWVASSSPFDGS
mmetsp:Transcript_59813/g.144486  ORF Transcript_59813/g.144486 Transcript_59813/m.144486 type:complete len:218 (+) Transcript_59813:2-655(+)